MSEKIESVKDAGPAKLAKANPPAAKRFTVVIRHSKHPTGQFVCEAADAGAAAKLAKAKYPAAEICEVKELADGEQPKFVRSARGGN